MEFEMGNEPATWAIEFQLGGRGGVWTTWAAMDNAHDAKELFNQLRQQFPQTKWRLI